MSKNGSNEPSPIPDELNKLGVKIVVEKNENIKRPGMDHFWLLYFINYLYSFGIS